MANDVFCTCRKWRKSAPQIFNAQVQFTLSTGVKYTGSKFIYCPWCSRLLTPRALDEFCQCSPKGATVQRVDAPSNRYCLRCGKIRQ